MKIISTTLSGNSESVIGDALASVVSWVDLCLVIDTGITDQTLEEARKVAGQKLVIRKYEWKNDFSDARNHALDLAHELGGDWAITLDTDERIDTRGADVRTLLARPGTAVYYVDYEDGSYSKERCFRLPMTKVRFEGPTHESFAAFRLPAATLEDVRFSELPKSPEAYRRKFERDARVLRAHVQAHPADPRWHFYLGETLRNLANYEEAIEAYKACANLRGWNEESAWACYRAGECHSILEQFRQGEEICAVGLSRHSGIAELAWLAALCAHRAGNQEQAVHWARMSIVMGLFRGRGAEVKRIGFRNLNALYEGPFDVLRFALAALGRHEEAAQATRDYHDAIAAREST